MSKPGQSAVEESHALHVTKPPEDENRRFVRRIMESVFAESCFGILIALIVALVIVQTNANAAGEMPPLWSTIWLFLLNIIHLFEMGFRIYGYSARVFFCDEWNCADFIVVVLDIPLAILQLAGSEFASRLSVVRMLRIVKVGRAFRTLEMFGELHLMMKGLASAVKSMFWGLVFSIVILLGWSILATQAMHPLNQELADRGVYADCDRCERAYASVFQSFLTFTQQIVAGDSWGQTTVPLIENYPWTGVFFAAVLVSINLLIINMILAAVCDSAAQARLGTEREIELECQLAHDKNMRAAKEDLVRLCGDIDLDSSGNITLQELQLGAAENPELKNALLLMGVQDQDLQAAFSIMDEDGSGTVDYHEFAQELLKMKNSDQHTMLGFIKHYVVEIRKKIGEQLATMQSEMMDEMDKHKDHMSIVIHGDAVASKADIVEDIIKPKHVPFNVKFEDMRENLTQLLENMHEKHDSHAAVLQGIHQHLQSQSRSGLAQSGVEELEFDADLLLKERSLEGSSLYVGQELDRQLWAEQGSPLSRCCTPSRELPDEMLLKAHKPTPPPFQRV